MRIVSLSLILTVNVAASRPADEWSEYRCDKYGFSMKTPKGSDFAEKEWENGWGGMIAECEGAEFAGLARLGVWGTQEEIEKIGVEMIGIPAEHWKLLDEGKAKCGWQWYRTVACVSQGVVVFAGYGTGDSGSYLLFLKTTEECVGKNEEMYKDWYKNLRLHRSRLAKETWIRYHCEKYGFSMLAPEGTKFEEKEYRDGWGYLRAKRGDVELWALAKIGTDFEPKEIARFGIDLSGIAEEHWQEIDAGENKRGWKWYRVAVASEGTRLVFGGYGVGSKSGYLAFLKTTAEDYEKHRKDYLTWYRSVAVK